MMFLMDLRKILSGVKQEDRARLVYEYMTQFAPVAVTPRYGGNGREVVGDSWLMLVRGK